MSTAIVPKEATAIHEEGLMLVGMAEEFEVIDRTTADAAGQFLHSIKRYQARVHEIMDPIVKAADAAHTIAVQQRTLLLGPALEAEKQIKSHLVAWEGAERERAAAQRRAQEEAARAAARAEQQRQVEDLKRTGQPAAAAAVAAAPPPIALTPPPPAPPKIEGVAFKETWSATVTDLKALVAAVAAGTQPLDLLAPNKSALDGLARALKSSLNIPGVEAKRTRQAATKS